MNLTKRNKFNVCNVTELLRFGLCPDGGGDGSVNTNFETV